jgi:UDP-N-acetyl-2-amino-2-deoxyglucuronate dehydrogenase
MSSPPPPLRLALIGCGRISRTHLDALARIPEIALVAVCDADRSRAEEVAAPRGIPAYDSIDAMLSGTAGAAVDVVSICTPSGLHAEHGIAAARAGKHVITEKPMALTLEQADALVSACDSAGVQLFVVKQNRLNPPIRLLRRAVDRGRFGRLYMANVTVRWQRPQEYYDAEQWRGTWALDGGAIMNQASHYVDLLQWLMGEPRRVMAITATQARRRHRGRRGQRAHLPTQLRRVDHPAGRKRYGEGGGDGGEPHRALDVCRV